MLTEGTYGISLVNYDSLVEFYTLQTIVQATHYFLTLFQSLFFYIKNIFISFQYLQKSIWKDKKEKQLLGAESNCPKQKLLKAQPSDAYVV